MSAKKVAVVDIGMGNLFSVRRACEHAGLQCVISGDKKLLTECDAMILPGVGAFGDAMESINERGLAGPLRDFIKSGKPFMGICLGMQLLMSYSEEFGRHEGLNIIKGSVVEFSCEGKDKQTIKVPQVGWNRANIPEGREEKYWVNTPLNGVRNGEYFYFVHSFYCVPEDPGSVLCVSEYEGQKYCSAVLKDNVFACQYHPEKSGSEGLKIYKNWADSIGK